MGCRPVQMQAAMESCPVKTVISGGMGFALGGMFGLFMSSVGNFYFYFKDEKLGHCANDNPNRCVTTLPSHPLVPP